MGSPSPVKSNVGIGWVDRHRRAGTLMHQIRTVHVVPVREQDVRDPLARQQIEEPPSGGGAAGW
jgi:hypothetical protein